MQPPRPETSKRDRRRTCRDRWRYQRQQRRRRTTDPATGVFLQLLALLYWIIGRGPVIPPPVPAPARPRPAPRLPDTRSPEAIERERGEGGRALMPPRREGRRHGRYRASPSYRRLVRDLQRPAARKEALDVLKKRLDLPPEARGWLDKLDENGDLAALLPHVRPGLSDLDSEASLLLAAVEWLEAQRDSELPPSSPTPPDDDDGRGGKGRDEKPPDDDDGPPPPGGTKI